MAAAKPPRKERGTMVNTNLFRDLLRYGTIKADFEVKDTMGCANCYGACLERAKAKVDEIRKSLDI